MTVKCLKPYVQQAIVCDFQNGKSIDHLVRFWGVSRRTIIRVLEDHGIDPGIRRRNKNPKSEPALIIQEARPPVTTPWYRRLGAALRRFWVMEAGQ